MRTFEELTATDQPAWPHVERLLYNAKADVEVLPADDAVGPGTLVQLQVSTGSTLGAVAAQTGGLLVDHGWLRVYGSPDPTSPTALPGLATVNRFPDVPDETWAPSHGLVVAHDVLGGTFALNGGSPADVGRPGSPGEIIYFAPDTLDWLDLGAGYTAWLTWVLDGGLDEFTAGLRPPEWQAETEKLRGDQGLTVYPPLWSAEAHADLAAATRATAPVTEVLQYNRDSARQIDGTDPGPLGLDPTT